MTTQSVNSLTSTLAASGFAAAQSDTTKYVRYAQGDEVSHGILRGDSVQELKQSFLDSSEPTGRTVTLDDVRLLAPVAPRKVFAVGLNYQSHIGSRGASDIPPIFLKLPTSIIGPGENIVIPDGAETVQYEAELVLVIGKAAKNVSVEDAPGHIFGVTCGNDVSGRVWQQSDLQWFRAKATDTFGPIGPCVVTGLDHDNLLLQGRLNGETGQEQRTSDLIHNTATIVSFLSQTVTLEPGDLIFTGTPGTTKTIKPGDVVDVELEGVGVLSNPVTGYAAPGE